MRLEGVIHCEGPECEHHQHVGCDDGRARRARAMTDLLLSVFVGFVLVAFCWALFAVMFGLAALIGEAARAVGIPA